jgi:hypothetical protein
MLSNRGNGLQNKTNVEIMNFHFLPGFLNKSLEIDRKNALKEDALNLKETEKDILQPLLYCCSNINER